MANKKLLARGQLIVTLEDELSIKILDKYTVTHLIKASGYSRSTVYNHFEYIDELYQCYFEEVVIPRIIVDCQSYDDIVIASIDFILLNRVLCLNLYHLNEFMHRENYLINMFADAFNNHEIPLNKLDENQRHLMSGVTFVLRTWFESKFRANRDEVITQLHEQGKVIKQYKKALYTEI
ncbi:TetR/AcrR family transcriptional regulator [Companilactobacillus ginsenosidimutans]|uniref:HTH tetR-type domain-containing protein n=1 Tax=Companilactobacillus ginsenosidimutans TaxID=1007676 RepID=A0A0H4QK02_9LACO|nr:TetR/AcrR family transcriptional regulator [Companilactobacillus ginsenosidimutans]AKP68252.1 hypothetical protein ABM34_12365 [Companilactobacillus ginsenosidimutans]